jgi:hypothetical protein
MACRESVRQAFDVTDQEVAAAVGERKREEKRSAFDLKPPIAGHRSFPNRFGGHGAEPVIGPRFARTRWRLCPPYACLVSSGGLFRRLRFLQ